MTMSYTKLDLADDDEVTARAMNHIETIADCALADLLTHDHDETYLSKTDADANYWSTDNGMDCNADTLQGSHASSLLGTGASLPIGTMVFWDGELAAIPSGWQLANGTNGTLDMRNYFPAGSSNTHTIGTTFGAATTTVSGSIMIDAYPDTTEVDSPPVVRTLDPPRGRESAKFGAPSTDPSHRAKPDGGEALLPCHIITLSFGTLAAWISAKVIPESLSASAPLPCPAPGHAWKLAA